MTQYGQTYLQSRAGFFIESRGRHRNDPQEQVTIYLLTYDDGDDNQLYLTKITDLVKQWTVSVATPDNFAYRSAKMTWNQQGIYVTVQANHYNGNVDFSIYRFAAEDGALLNSVTQAKAGGFNERIGGIHSLYDTGEIIILNQQSFGGNWSGYTYDFELNLTNSEAGVFTGYSAIGSGPFTLGEPESFIFHVGIKRPVTAMDPLGDIYIGTDGVLNQIGPGSNAPRYYAWRLPRVSKSNLKWYAFDPTTLWTDNYRYTDGVFGLITGGFKGDPTHPNEQVYPVANWSLVGDQRNLTIQSDSNIWGFNTSAGRDDGFDTPASNLFFSTWETSSPMRVNSFYTADFYLVSNSDPYLTIPGRYLWHDSRATDYTVDERNVITDIFTALPPTLGGTSQPVVQANMRIKNSNEAIVVGSYSRPGYRENLWFGRYYFDTGTVRTLKRHDHVDIDLIGHRTAWVTLAQPGEGQGGYAHYKSKGATL